MYETYRLSALCLAAHAAGPDRGFGEGGMSFRVTVTATNGLLLKKDPRHLYADASCLCLCLYALEPPSVAADAFE